MEWSLLDRSSHLSFAHFSFDHYAQSQATHNAVGDIFMYCQFEEGSQRPVFDATNNRTLIAVHRFYLQENGPRGPRDQMLVLY